jgi:hypothetical protein
MAGTHLEDHLSFSAISSFGRHGISLTKNAPSGFPHTKNAPPIARALPVRAVTKILLFLIPDRKGVGTSGTSTRTREIFRPPKVLHYARTPQAVAAPSPVSALDGRRTFGTMAV